MPHIDAATLHQITDLLQIIDARLDVERAEVAALLDECEHPVYLLGSYHEEIKAVTALL